MEEKTFILFFFLAPLLPTRDRMKKSGTKLPDPVPFETRIMTHEFNNDEEKEAFPNEPLAAGLFVDLTNVSENDPDTRQTAILAAVKRAGLRKPIMAIDLAPMRELQLVLDGKDWEEPEELKANPKPPCAFILLSAYDIVDLSKIKPSFGQSVVRCNSAVPHIRWFQAANLILTYEDKPKTGRVVPFPLENPKTGETIYHFMRCTFQEYVQYNKLLKHAVNEDGLKKGFWLAAKYSYQALNDRGYHKLTADNIETLITHAILMGNSKLRGVLVDGATSEDFDEDLQRAHHIYY